VPSLSPHTNLISVPRHRLFRSPFLLVATLTLILFSSGCVTPANSQHRESPTRDVVRSAGQLAILNITASRLGAHFAPGAVGLSLETNELSTGELNDKHKPLVALMRRLGPGVLRFGGGSVDESWWTSSGEAPPSWTKSTITPADLTALRQLLDATGWRTILGINLGHFNPTRAADEARAAESILGARLLGFGIGNEPDKYSDPVVRLRSSSYNAKDYLHELATYGVAIRAAAPNSQFYGPDLSSQYWLPAIAANRSISFTGITMHYYPTSYSIPKGACKGTSVPSALSLLSAQTRERENATLQTLVAAGTLAERETRISETNTTSSCDYHGGPDTSPVFASALWSLDWILRAASLGISGINFHGDFGECAPDTFSPICAKHDRGGRAEQVIARPEYYGLLAARELEGGSFIPVEPTGQFTVGSFTAYATVHSQDEITLAIDNFATKKRTNFLLSVPGYDRATYQRLTGSSLRATRGVTFGHASFNTRGILRPSKTTIPLTASGFLLEVPPESGIIVTLHR
jgi:hypothetical protein